jgi:hypothetical protein
MLQNEVCFMIYDIILLNCYTYAEMNIFCFIGVTEFYGMEKVSISYRMFAGNQDFPTIDLFTEYFGLRLSHLMEN